MPSLVFIRPKALKLNALTKGQFYYESVAGNCRAFHDIAAI